MRALKLAGGILDRDSAAVKSIDQKEVIGLLAFALWANRGSPWWIGDVLIRAEELFGDDFWQYVPSGYSLDAIQRQIGVARKVPKANRVMGLSWTHHAYVAPVPLAKQRMLLEYAQQVSMPSGEFRKYVSEWRRSHA